MSLKYPELLGQTVGYILMTHDGLYRACVGRVIASGDDHVFSLSAAFNVQCKLQDTHALFDNVHPSLSHIFKVPLPRNLMGIAWQSEAERVEDENQNSFAIMANSLA